MVYSEKFVAYIVCNGQILREIRENGDDSVRLPFGSDYSIRFKNMHSQRAIVSVEVDGKDALNGSQLVIDANSKGELEGFMKGDVVHNKFRFIKKTNQIAKHRGDFIDDGFVRISWQYEKPVPEIEETHHHHYDHYHYPPICPPVCPPFDPYWHRKRKRKRKKRWDDGIYWTVSGPSTGGQTRSTYLNPGSVLGSCSLNVQSCDQVVDNISETKTGFDFNGSLEGLTVAGSDTHQEFSSTCIRGLEEQVHTIVIHLLDQDSKGEKIATPKLVKTKEVCSTCGKKNKSSCKFCSSCGTRLI